MRILNIIPHYVPAFRYGGPLRVAHSLGKALVHCGHEVYVVTTNRADDDALIDKPVDTSVDVDGVTVYYEPTAVLRYWGFSPKLWRRADHEIAQADLVLVHAHYQFANWAGARLARRHQTPYVIFSHASLHRQGIAHKSSWKKRLYLRLLEEGNFRDALFIAFNAPEEQEYSLYGELGRVIPSGIDPAEFADRPEAGYFRRLHSELQNKTIYLFLGRLDVEHKGLDLLIPAFATLAQSDPTVHLVLAGPDEDGGANRIRSLAHQAGIADRLTLTGLIKGSVKLAALQDADVFVLPSRFEGLSIALLEALYMGLPMVVTDQVGLSQEIAQIGAGLVVSPEVAALTNALRQMADEEVRSPMRGPGTVLIERKYTWNAIAQDFINQIELMLGSVAESESS